MTLRKLLEKNLKTTFKLSADPNWKRVLGEGAIKDVVSKEDLDKEITMIGKEVYIKEELKYSGITFIHREDMDKIFVKCPEIGSIPFMDF